MTPSFAQIMLGAAGAVAAQLGPRLKDDAFAIGQAQIIGLLMVLVAQEADRAADTLSLETVAMRALFAEASESPLPEGLRRRLRAMAESAPPENFTISGLEKIARPMKALLIELHEAVEDRPDEWARPLEAKCWDVLKLGADHRQLFMPGM
ncbi:MAG: hypothetical protein HXY28_01015 [Hydrogenophilaceae bacterium]|jgi:hypothetical protein|nr:hypothetical protein [Hydrogenophilaceae bacterium]